jgi:hypothetical protein
MVQFMTWKVTAVNQTKVSSPTTLLSMASRMPSRTKKDSDKELLLAVIKVAPKTTITDHPEDREE